MSITKKKASCIQTDLIRIGNDEFTGCTILKFNGIGLFLNLKNTKCSSSLSHFMVTSEVEKSNVYKDLERVMDWKESEKIQANV
jgi:hypothetical protein